MKKLGGTNDTMNALFIVILRLKKKNGAYILVEYFFYQKWKFIV